ncbi:hypothetical protein MTR67_002618 [Solanum verrucosum]|uniref:Reverse transcriptase domain-containing protein n=1 Tax=Solanum verrucosum TaxID=315347 RepID=A0AAF0T9K6_SOLVR|nr:hypothetical protein MTR67_002618 [Solanum verrucosum]
MDAVLIANEAVDSRISQKKPGILCKLDIEKAYDHVNWEFILQVLRQMGFGAKWVNWVKFCISTVKFSILVNGGPEGFFNAQRGIRQGDPMSPFLFILAMEGLNSVVKVAITNGWIRGFEVAKNNNQRMEITHLQYADDTLIFCGAEEEQLKYLRVILILFEAISGLHINWRKSHIYPINHVPDMELLAIILGGEVGNLPTIYLGMPLGAKSNSKGIWDSVLEKCEKKLTGWKSQYLSLGGRLTLINAVLDALPTYMLSLFPIPPGVIQRLDKAPQTLWSRVIKSKYGEEDNWVSKEVNTPYGISLWRTIRRYWPFLKNHSHIRVVNGNKTRFWKDKWIGIRSLIGMFPDLFVVALDQHKTVAEMWTQQGWDLRFRRMLNDWEIPRLAELFN